MVQKAIIDYRVVTCADKKKFEEAIMQMITKYNYELVGGVSVVDDGGIIYHQAMILREEDKFANIEKASAASDD